MIAHRSARPLIPLLCVATSIVACYSVEDPDLGRKISSASQSGVVSMAELTTFDWERLFVFGPYTPASRVEAELGFSWSGSSKIEKHDHFALLVFVEKNRVARFVAQPRGPADFSTCHRATGFSRGEATFQFTTNSGSVRTCTIHAR